MAKKIVLPPATPKRPTPAAFSTPPAAAPGTASSPFGQLPQPVGQTTFVPKRLTPDERKALETIGWKDGDPVPNDMAERISATADDVRREAVAYVPPVAPDRPPLALPQVVDINSVSPEKRRELSAALQEARHGRTAASMEVQGAAPGVNEAIRAATASPDILLEDDRESATYSAGAPKEEADQPVTLTQCGHCGRDPRQGMFTEPSGLDRQVYMAAMLGGKPFTKEYTFFGGKMKATYRELSTREIDLIFKCCHGMQMRDELKGLTEMTEQLYRFRLCLQLQRIVLDGVATEFAESFDDWQYDAEIDDSDKLIQIEQYVRTTAMSHESVFRVLSMQCVKFGSLVSVLESNVTNSDFWEPTAPST